MADETSVVDDLKKADERFAVAVAYGFTVEEAGAFAFGCGDDELRQLMWMRDTGCPPATAARILL